MTSHPKDPLIRAVKKAYRNSDQYRFDKLIEERRKWARRSTIAANKLEVIESELRAFTAEMVEKANHPKGAA